ncbi:MAG: peptidase, partial [Halobacteriaceae archaeon]
MSRSPSLPDRPTLDLDPDTPPDERLEALKDHYFDIVEVHQQLE